jgi:hypothetical protein
LDGCVRSVVRCSGIAGSRTTPVDMIAEEFLTEVIDFTKNQSLVKCSLLFKNVVYIPLDSGGNAAGR